MSVWIAVVLGLVQGLCEFLPVSSSGHLFLLSKAFGIEEGSEFYSIMLHIGTLVAVVFVYRRQIWALIKKPLQWKTYMLIISTVVTVAIYLLFNSFFEKALGTGFLLGYSFLFTAALLLVVDRLSVSFEAKKSEKDGSLKSMKWYSAVGIGAMQGIGILPGVSRSGSTIAGARLLGLNREAAAEYSFLLSIPAIIGGFATEVLDVAKTGIGDITVLPIVIGMLVAAVSGYVAVKFMIMLITKKSLWGFSIYLGILGLFVILDMNVFHLINW